MWNILNQAGIDPAPRRTGPTRKQFLTAQAEHIVAVDFLHVDTIDLKRIYALVMLEHGSRRGHLLGVTANPSGPWTTQAARNILMDTDMKTNGHQFLIRDRGGQFTDAGLRILKARLRPRKRTHTAKDSSAPNSASSSTEPSSSTNSTCTEPSAATWSTTTNTGPTVP